MISREQYELYRKYASEIWGKEFEKETDLTIADCISLELEKTKQELDKYKNIVDELERYMNTICLDATFEEVGITQSILKRLKELKEGSDR